MLQAAVFVWVYRDRTGFLVSQRVSLKKNVEKKAAVILLMILTLLVTMAIEVCWIS